MQLHNANFKTPLIYILVLNWNNLSDSCCCLDALLNLKYDNYKILLIDNGSTDGSLQELKKIYEGNQYIHFIENEKNLGFGSGLSLRLKQNGLLLCINEKVEVYHKEGGSLKHKAQLMETYSARSLVVFLYKNSKCFAAFIFFAFLPRVVKRLMGFRFGSLRAMLRGVREGVLNCCS
jgi:hypothetical protein